MPLFINRGSQSWSWRPLTASLMLLSLIFQSEEGEKPPPPPPSSTQLGFGKSFPFRSNCPSTEKLGEKTGTLIPRLGEVAAISSGLPIPGLTGHKPWGGEDPLRNFPTTKDRRTKPPSSSQPSRLLEEPLSSRPRCSTWPHLSFPDLSLPPPASTNSQHLAVDACKLLRNVKCAILKLRCQKI